MAKNTYFRRKAYVSSSIEGFLEFTRPGPDSSSVFRIYSKKPHVQRPSGPLRGWFLGINSENTRRIRPRPGKFQEALNRRRHICLSQRLRALPQHWRSRRIHSRSRLERMQLNLPRARRKSKLKAWKLQIVLTRGCVNDRSR